VVLYDEDDATDDPLKAFWLEGDSLAPPCQAEQDIVDAILGACYNNVQYSL
jgi:hypothetical protein